MISDESPSTDLYFFPVAIVEKAEEKKREIYHQAPPKLNSKVLPRRVVATWQGVGERTVVVVLAIEEHHIFRSRSLEDRSSLQQISGWYLGLRSAFFTSGPSCSCTPSSGRDSSFLRLPAHVARRRAGHISSVPSHDRISFAPRPRVDGGAVGDCNWDDLSSPSNILFNLSHGRNTFPNTSGGSPLLGRHRQWYVIHRIFYALVLSSRYLSRGSRDLYVSLLIISSSHTSNLSLVFRFRSQAWSIRPRGRNISHLLHLHDLLDVRS